MYHIKCDGLVSFSIAPIYTSRWGNVLKDFVICKDHFSIKNWKGRGKDGNKWMSEIEKWGKKMLMNERKRGIWRFYHGLIGFAIKQNPFTLGQSGLFLNS